MSTIILTTDKEVEVQVGDKLFHMCQGDDGSLYIEGVGRRCVEVTISDDADEQVTAVGLWVNIDLKEID